MTALNLDVRLVPNAVIKISREGWLATEANGSCDQTKQLANKLTNANLIAR